MENTPLLTTKRLILRRFTTQDIEAVFHLYHDPEVNTFLPMFPLQTLAEAERLVHQTYFKDYQATNNHHYAICLKSDNVPIGAVHVSGGESHDVGYALRKEFWHMGIVTEACRAVIEMLRFSGMPFVTATHDINNPRSGEVMKKIGMTYRYSYEEQWQPKNRLVTFRLYQLNFTVPPDYVYRTYWDTASVHWIEKNL